MAIKPITYKTSDIVEISGVYGRTNLKMSRFNFVINTLLPPKDGFYVVSGTYKTQVLRGTIKQIDDGRYALYCKIGVGQVEKSFEMIINNLPEWILNDSIPSEKLITDAILEYSYYPDSASLFEGIKLNKNIDPLDTKELVERILKESLNRIMRIDENRSSSEFKKASDTMVSAFERWEKYAKTGDWDLKDAQYVIGNLEYIIKGIKKLA